jgi:hypothetical protein
MNIAAESVPTGRSSPTPGASSKKISISPNTPILSTIPWIPHVIVLEPGLIVYKIYNGYWFFGRPTIEDLRQDLRAVTRKCRPDWDITTPELKAAWQQGRKELFYPYGKRTPKLSVNRIRVKTTECFKRTRRPANRPAFRTIDCSRKFRVT